MINRLLYLILFIILTSFTIHTDDHIQIASMIFLCVCIIRYYIESLIVILMNRPCYGKHTRVFSIFDPFVIMLCAIALQYYNYDLISLLSIGYVGLSILCNLGIKERSY